jgi:hypothetical protein
MMMIASRAFRIVVRRVQLVGMMTLAGHEAGQGTGCENEAGFAKE